MYASACVSAWLGVSALNDPFGEDLAQKKYRNVLFLLFKLLRQGKQSTVSISYVLTHAFFPYASMRLSSR